MTQVCEYSPFRSRSLSVDSPPASRSSAVHSHGTDPALRGPRRTAEPTGSTCGEAAHLHSESLKVRARALPPHTRCARSLALRRAASPHPALTRRHPRSAGRHPQRHHTRWHRSASSSTARTMLTGATLSPATVAGNHARRHHARRFLARCRRALPPLSASVLSADKHAAVRLPAQAGMDTRPSMHRSAARCTLNSAHMSRCELVRVFVVFGLCAPCASAL